MKYTVYLIKNKEQVIYVGLTNDFKRRCREHKYKGSKNSVLPVDVDLSDIEFIPVREFDNKSDAINLQKELKANGYNEPKPEPVPMPMPIVKKPISQKVVQKQSVEHKTIGKRQPIKKIYRW